MVAWPETLPQAFLLESYEELEPDTAIWSQPELGPAIGRRRTSAAGMPFAGTMILTKAQKAILRAFWRDTLASGTAVVQFPAQDGSGDTWDCRIPTRPSYTPATHNHWRASLTMELLPFGVTPALTGNSDFNGDFNTDFGGSL